MPAERGPSGTGHDTAAESSGVVTSGGEHLHGGVGAGTSAPRSRVVFRFKLSVYDRWNWPIEGEDAIRAFREILQRAEIEYTVRDAR